MAFMNDKNPDKKDPYDDAFDLGYKSGYETGKMHGGKTPIHPEKDYKAYNPLAYPNETGQDGKTLLDDFAGKAMEGFISKDERSDEKSAAEYIAGKSYEQAEAMLKERQKYFNNENE